MSAAVLWAKPLLTATDLAGLTRGSQICLTLKTIVTPLARDELQARGLIIIRDGATVTAPAVTSAWAVASDRPYPTVVAATAGSRSVTGTPAELADGVAHGAWPGVLLFTAEPELAACVANKLAGVRAVSVAAVSQLARVMRTLAPNLVAVEMPGRTLFEVRQLAALCLAMSANGPDWLTQLERGHDCRCQPKG